MLLKNLIKEDDDREYLMFQDAVLNEMKRLGIDDADWGISLQNLIRDAYENGASLNDTIQSLEMMMSPE